MKMNTNRSWSRLDNAAKIFPPNVTGHDTKVFRFACILKEQVDQTVLQRALEQTLVLFPIFQSVLKQGLFWCYLEHSEQIPQVELEDIPPCAALYDPSRRNLLIRISYYDTRINFEVFHAVTDGTGALCFLRSLVSRYLQLIHHDVLEDKTLSEDDPPLDLKGEDSFLKYYNPDQKKKRNKKSKAYRIRRDLLPQGRLQVLEGIMSVKEILRISKEYGVTMSVFLTSLLIQAIGEDMPVRYRHKPVVAAVPVNLRNFFPSGTVRNFFGLINVSYRFDWGSGSLEDIMQEVKRQFEQELTKEKMEARIGQMASLERNPLLRIVPWVVKNRVLRIANRVSQRYSTTSISNVGRISMPKELEDYIERFDVFVSTDRLQICVCSFRDRLSVSTTSSFLSTQIQARFFRKLTELGVEVEIQSNLQVEEAKA